jgi:ABC-type multidrug transport system fused ATPase/permease subunit
MERIDVLLKQDEPIASPESAEHLSKTPKTMSFKEVHFEYLEGQNILKGMDFVIEAGQTVALVGHTGAGKSTIIHLINRLYDVTKGQVCVDGVDVRELDLEAWRRQVATIPQDVVIFDGSLLDNIRLFDREDSVEKVQSAIDGLGLGDFVSELPEGLGTMMGESGFRLSEGQQQLVAFARAWVKEPQVLILDEATASVDSRTERQLETALANLRKNRTTILIAHRLSTIQSADRIFVLDHGRVAEKGTHRELLEQKGIYEKLYRRQALSLMVESKPMTLS